ncbi:hypothetical protein C7H52_12945, partial [Aurantibacter aestuarii]
ETGTTPNCTDENSFVVTINASPDVFVLANQTECNSYTLPAITGTGLVSPMYYTGPGGTGTAYTAGTTLNDTDFASYPVTIYIYDETGTTPNCSDEESFSLTINTCNVSVTATASPSSTCSSAGTTVTLTATPSPAIAVGTYSYSWNVQGNATVLGTNSTLNVSPLVTTTYEVTVTDSGLIAPNNTATNTVVVTVYDTPDIMSLSNQEACDSFTLPAITGTNLVTPMYYTGIGGTGTAYASGSVLNFADFASYPVTIYIYDETGTTPNCFDEESFSLTINATPTADAPADVTACDSYVLPALNAGNTYYTGSGGTGTVIASGTSITTTQTIYVYAETGTTPNCTDENSFVVTINTTPTADAPADVTACDSYVLPALSAGNTYYTG